MLVVTLAVLSTILLFRNVEVFLPTKVVSMRMPFVLCRRTWQRCSCSAMICFTRPARSRSRCGAEPSQLILAGSDVPLLPPGHAVACCPQPCHLGLGAQVEGLQAALAAKDRRIEDLRSAEAASDAQCQALQEQQKVGRPGVALLPSAAPWHARTMT